MTKCWKKAVSPALILIPMSCNLAAFKGSGLVSFNLIIAWWQRTPFNVDYGSHYSHDWIQQEFTVMSTLTIFAYQAWISSYLYFWNNQDLIKDHNFIMLKFSTDCRHKYRIFGLYFWEAIMTSIIWEKVTVVCLHEITIVAHEQLQTSHCRWCRLLL